MRRPTPCIAALTLALLGPSACQKPERPEQKFAQASVPEAPALALAPLPTAQTGPMTAEITRLQALLRQSPKDAEAWGRLARAFALRARQGLPELYAQARDAADHGLAINPKDQRAIEVRLAVLLNAHQFRDARRAAEEVLQRAPQDIVAWGTLGDAALELGDYALAAGAYQRMIDLKPNLRSYNRGAWLRWLSGDGEGAEELMLQAAAAGHGEPRAFCLTQLGDIQFWRGRYTEARQSFDAALQAEPNYPAAQASRGRLLLATGQTADALTDLAASLSTLPLTSTRASYIEALWAAGRDADAREELTRLAREGEREDPRTLALFYATHDLEHARAVELARREVDARPDIFSQDALAWALYRDGQIDAAWTAIQAATKLGTKDPRLLYHRGLIAARRDGKGEAIATLKLALAQSPRWDRREPDEARAALARLGGAL